ncbi:MAG: class I SAM-dependent methyltransferase [Candidatus Omnitrophica bacterium]|nr:class I SAM-dependent methyltransferase [Candidatus Omnitrophota bacterium]
MHDTIKMEAFPDCIICGIHGEGIYNGLVDNFCGVKGEFSISRCPKCGLLWLNPRPSADDVDKCYGSNYFTHEGDFNYKRGPLAPLKDAVRGAILCGKYGYRHLHKKHVLCRAGKLLSKIPAVASKATYGMESLFPFFKTSGFIVDIGCGSGEYLEIMQRLGWSVLGVEPDLIAAGVAEKNGIPVFKGTLKEAGLEASSADQIVMRHVIEHVPDPLDTINECFRILKKGGRLIIRTPNAGSLSHEVFKRNCLILEAPRHMFVFSPKTARRIFEKSPFKEFSVTTSAKTAECIYDHSVLISKANGTLDMKNKTPQKGRFWFALKESFLCRCGQERGEEIEIIAVK